MIRPMSSQLTMRASRTSPVSGSTSTSQAWAPLGQEGVEGVSVAETRNAFCGWRAASSASPMARSVPAILKAPSQYSMSPGAVSSASAASSLPRAMVLRPAATTARPPPAAQLPGPRRKPLPVGQFDKPVDDAREIAAVVDIAEVRAIREILRPDEIAPPDLYGVEPHLARGFLHQPLHEIVRLRPACPAVGAGRHAVSQHRLDAIIHGGNVVDSRLYLRAQRERNDRRGADRQRADVAERFHAHSDDAAVAIERQP